MDEPRKSESAADFFFYIRVSRTSLLVKIYCYAEVGIIKKYVNVW